MIKPAFLHATIKGVDQLLTSLDSVITIYKIVTMGTLDNPWAFLLVFLCGK